MKIESITFLRGRNIYSHTPVIRMVVDLENLCNKTTKDFDGFSNTLLELLPGISDHYCGLGHKGGFKERLREGTYFGHVLEHIALELQVLTGYEVYYGKTRLLEEPSKYTVIFEYINEHVAVECAKSAIAIIEGVLGKKELKLDDILKKLTVQKDRFDLGPSTKAIFDEAKRRGIPVRRLGNDSILELGYGKFTRLIQASITDSTNSISVDIACNKELTKQLLMEFDVPVPYGEIAYSKEEAVSIADSIGYPVVLKPLDGNQGKGVVLNIVSASEVDNNYSIPAAFSESILVEKYITGRDYRVLVIGGKISAVAERTPPFVIGDGKRSIKELIEAENTNKKRGDGHSKPLSLIALDDVVKNYLCRNGLNVNSIPENGRKIYLRENGNLSTGGSARECTDEIHPANAELAIRAARAIGLDIAGIDIIAKDISVPIDETEGCIIEVNAAPGLRMHLSPGSGKSINVASDILDMVYPPDSPYSMPIAAITGTNGKTTTTRLVQHTLRQQGYVVGMTTTSGIYIDDKCIQKGDNTGAISARTLLRNKSIDAAVLEVARGGIIKRGLGYDLADVGVITNISEDHIGMDGVEDIEDLAFVKALVVEAIKPEGYAIINADDSMAEYFLERTRSSVILFSRDNTNSLVRNHLKSGGIAVYAKNNSIYINKKQVETLIIDINEIPITFRGALNCNIENSLAAAAALVGLKLSYKAIARGLASFKPDFEMNPGRFNIFNMGKFKIMIDYGHNSGGFEEVAKFAEKVKADRLVGIIGMPGDRNNQSLIKGASICGRIFSKIYIKEDDDLRGRRPGEVAGILFDEIKKTHEDDDLKIVLSEAEALKAAIADAKEGDFIIHFYENLASVLEIINEFKVKYLKRVIVANLDHGAFRTTKKELMAVSAGLGRQSAES